MPQKEVVKLKHELNIIVSKKPKNGGVVTCRQVSVRERLMRFIFGDRLKLTVIVPGDTVDELKIREKGENFDDQLETASGDY